MIDFFPLDMNLFYKFKVNQSMGSQMGIRRSDALSMITLWTSFCQFEKKSLPLATLLSFIR